MYFNINIYIVIILVFKMETGKLATTARYLLGIAMAFFGINGFLQFMTPPPLTDRDIDFFVAMVNTGYLFEFINVIFIVVAVLLLMNKYVPLALVLLFPITLNIVLFHIFLSFVSGVAGFIVFILNVYLMFVYSRNFKSLLAR